MNAMQQLLTEHMAIWTAADTEKKSGRGRASGNAGSVYGIKKLRELILELAVRGKLVPQNSKDEPASELLKRIQAEKSKLVAEGKVKKYKPLTPISDDEKPFELPQGWEWVKLTDVGYTQTGTTPSKSEVNAFGNDVPFVKPGDIHPNFVDYENEGLSFSGAKNGRVAPAGSLLMVCIGTIGKCNIIDKDCSFNQQINSITPFLLDSRYLLIAGRANFFQSECWSNSSSTTLPILNKGKWEQICLPLPPLAEQQRIVAKVDELMALCDQLEAHHSNAAEAHEKLVSHLLGTLTQSQSADDFSTNWQRIAAHFDTLFITEASIGSLKQTLLQLAVMGKLVPQNPNDESASELLKRIQAEKAKLVAEGKIKNGKQMSPITFVEKSFDLPQGWVRIKLGAIIELISGQHLNPSEYFEKPITASIPYITGPADFGDRGPIPTRHTLERRALSIYGDILVTVKGSGVGKINTVCQSELAISRQLMAVRPIIMNVNFVEKLLITLEKLFQRLTVGIAIPGISREDVLFAVIDLPPLPEQHRIVAKVDALMTLCDQLKTRITAAKQQQQKLADVLVEQAVA